MGQYIARIFVDPEALPQDAGGFVQLLFLMAVYGYILTRGSTMIKDGSELLLLVPSMAGIVGSIVLPVLGAVPDGAIVVFSGLGNDAQKQVSVGIGALAGSTIVLLTVAWTLVLFGGRVNLINNGTQANYRKPKSEALVGWQKLTPGKYRGTGLAVGDMIRYNSRVMLVTLISFIIIQAAASHGDCTLQSDDARCKTPKFAALGGAITATLLFAFYLWDQARLAKRDEVKEAKIDELRIKAVNEGLISFSSLFPSSFIDLNGAVPVEASNKRFQHMLMPYFRRFDVDGNGVIDREEFILLLRELGEDVTPKRIDEFMRFMDKDGTGTISFEEFAEAVASIIHYGKNCLPQSDTYGSTRDVRETTNIDAPPADASSSKSSKKSNTKGSEAKKKADAEAVSAVNATAMTASDTVESDDSESDEEGDIEMPEDIRRLPPEAQQRRLIMRSCYMMGVGVAVVLLFSDPMCDCLSALGNRLHISPFYVAFVLSAFASNASELIAAFAYAQRRTEKTATIALSSLLGAACMNNTFCLSLFLYLIFARDLRWEFSAETIAIFAVEFAMFIFAQFRIQRWEFSFIIFALFPLSLGLVVILEQVAGLN